MGFFTDNTPAPVVKIPTLDDRIAVQQSASDAAVDLFFRAASNLERAAEELDAIAAESSAKAEAHALRAENADEQAAANRVRAAKIRNLLG